MTRQRKSRNVDLRVYCTSGHEAELMYLQTHIDPRNAKEITLQCPVCSRTNTVLLNPRREVTSIFGGEFLVPEPIESSFNLDDVG